MAASRFLRKHNLEDPLAQMREDNLRRQTKARETILDILTDTSQQEKMFIESFGYRCVCLTGQVMMNASPYMRWQMYTS